MRWFSRDGSCGVTLVVPWVLSGERRGACVKPCCRDPRRNPQRQTWVAMHSAWAGGLQPAAPARAATAARGSCCSPSPLQKLWANPRNSQSPPMWQKKAKGRPSHTPALLQFCHGKLICTPQNKSSMRQECRNAQIPEKQAEFLLCTGGRHLALCWAKTGVPAPAPCAGRGNCCCSYSCLLVS